MAPGKKGLIEPVACGVDALPDGILEHILGFLPVEDSGRTSLLARRWRNLWKSATGLHISCVSENWHDSRIVMRKRKVVEDMLRLRGTAPLETCQLTFGCFYSEDDKACLNRWLRHIVVTCKVQVFRLENFYYDSFKLDDRPLFSRHLTRLQLVGVCFENDFCDFSECPSLERLELDHCFLWVANKISSESLKRLSITNCDLGVAHNILICVPSVVSLCLDSHMSSPPLLGTMPLLREAFVRVSTENNYILRSPPTHSGKKNPYSRICDDEDCYSCHDIIENSSKCMFLEGLSEAQKLTLLSESITFIFGRDLKHCPTFSKLQKLVLSASWCVAPDFTALIFILKNSPVLETLILQFYSKVPEHEMEIVGRYHTASRSAAIFEHLRAIHVKCEVVDHIVHKVLKFLCTYDIYK